MWEVLETMRVISQDGTTDVPYENVVLYQDEKEIMCIFSGIYIGRKLAQYSTEAKALKAMKMLREAFFKNKHEETYREGIYYYSPCFQFPQDDEIEV